MSKTLIPIGDGRVVEHTEGVLTNPPPPPKRTWQRKFRDPNRIAPPKQKPPSHSRPNRKNETTLYSAIIDGYREYRQFIHASTLRYANNGHVKGQIEGYNLIQLAELMDKAKEQAKKDMENIKKTIEVNEMAEEALTGALTVLRAPSTQQTKLQAAKLILEFTRSKPVAKSEVSVNSAEKWLESLASDDDA